jgi:flagellar biosynthesis protein FlhF
MNCKRFTAKTSRDALSLVRQALGADAVVLSTKPCAEGVEVLAMAPEGMAQIEKLSSTAPKVSAAPALPAVRRNGRDAQRAEPTLPITPVEDDVQRLSMSTLSFQDFVRERMLRRRQEALNEGSRFPDDALAAPTMAAQPVAPQGPIIAPRQPEPERPSVLGARMAVPATEPGRAPQAAIHREPPLLSESLASEIHVPAAMPAAAPAGPTLRDHEAMLAELRQVKGLIEERFGALAFMEKLQRQPTQARLTQKLLDCGFSPALIRKLAESLPMDVADESLWAAGVLERNVMTSEAEGGLEDQGGVYALIGPTGVGKTTTTAKLAAAFATKYGAANLGLITLDAYRVGAHEQLRAYGRILGVPVHTAHDRASLEDLLELLAAKKMVLIDTAGMAQRDTRTRELLEMLQHRSIRKLLVINAAAQGETIEDVMISYRAAACAGIVLSKMDEAVKLGPAIDALIRHKLKVIGVANGQRVPEDWHRLSANALVHRALRGGGSSAYKLDAGDVSLIFAAPRAGVLHTTAALQSSGALHTAATRAHAL